MAWWIKLRNDTDSTKSCVFDNSCHIFWCVNVSFLCKSALKIATLQENQRNSYKAFTRITSCCSVLHGMDIIWGERKTFQRERLTRSEWKKKRKIEGYVEKANVKNRFKRIDHVDVSNGRAKCFNDEWNPGESGDVDGTHRITMQLLVLLQQIIMILKTNVYLKSKSNAWYWNSVSLILV